MLKGFAPSDAPRIESAHCERTGIEAEKVRNPINRQRVITQGQPVSRREDLLERRVLIERHRKEFALRWLVLELVPCLASSRRAVAQVNLPCRRGLRVWKP